LASVLVLATPPALDLVLAPAKVSLAAVALFEFDKSELMTAGLDRLDRLLLEHKGAALDMVIAVGHSNAVGNEALNNALSLARAKTVRAYLVSKGVDVKRVRAVDLGEGRSVAENHTDEGGSKNRRADVALVPRPAAIK